MNGSPPEFSGEGEGIVVLDIWDDWCPVCREVAPGLVQVYHEFPDCGVEFVSIAQMSELGVRQFVDDVTKLVLPESEMIIVAPPLA